MLEAAKDFIYSSIARDTVIAMYRNADPERRESIAQEISEESRDWGDPIPASDIAKALESMIV